MGVGPAVVPEGGMLLAKSMSVDADAGIADGSGQLGTALPLGIGGTPSGSGAGELPARVFTKSLSSASSDEIWANSAVGCAGVEGSEKETLRAGVLGSGSEASDARDSTSASSASSRPTPTAKTRVMLCCRYRWL